MNITEKLSKISEYLSKSEVVNQYTHFVIGVYIVQVRNNSRFSPKFLAWLDYSGIEAVYLASVLNDEVYSIVVKED